MSLISLFRAIFLERAIEKNPKPFPRDLTAHYKNELHTIAFDRILVATKYSEIEHMLHAFKYDSMRENVEVLGELLSKVVEQYEYSSSKESIIIPVPMHWSRYFTRGYNHIHLLVEVVSKVVDIPWKKALRTKWTPHQSRLTREKRLENKENSLTIIPHTSLPETVLLIDDVISTGSTANECAKLLKAQGVKCVIGLFLASNAQ